MAKGDPMFFASKGYRGWRGVFFFLFPRAEAVYTARWLMEERWRGADVGRTLCAFALPDGSLWRIVRGDGRQVRRVTESDPEREQLAGFVGANMRPGF